MSSPLVFIDGDQGTTGLQIHERLRGRTDLSLFTLAASERKDPRRRAEAINACDIAILCLPDAAAREAVDAIVNPAVRVIDASSAHRTHPDWTYGFPEMAPGQARASRTRDGSPIPAAIRPVRLACCVPWCRPGLSQPAIPSAFMLCPATPDADVPAWRRMRGRMP